MRQALRYLLVVLLIGLGSASSASAQGGCDAWQGCSCGLTARCSGSNICSRDGSSVTCDGATTTCSQVCGSGPGLCTMSCPNNPSITCTGTYCYYWEDYYSLGTSAIYCPSTPVGAFPGTEASSCGGGSVDW
jgi:hypothetical protein